MSTQAIRRFFRTGSRSTVAADPRARAASAPEPVLGSQLLKVSGLGARYGASQVLWDVTLTVNRGELVTVLGNNGAGKTTLLNTIMGVVTSVGGSVEFDGVDLAGRSPEHRVEAGIVLCPEGRRIFGGMTVEENLRLGAGLRYQADFEAKRDEIFERFPVLERLRGQMSGNLSGGEQQQLAIGRALMARPRLLLLDEPSLGLAPKIVSAIFELIAELREAGITMMLVEQNARQALEVADRAYVLGNGRVEVSGAAAELRHSEDVEAAYLGL